MGTLLALLVFFALFGVFLTQYVPLWMTQNESQFTAQAEGSLALLKSSVDEQYAIQGPPTYAIPFTVSSQGIPLIAQPTEGVLSFVPPSCPGGFFAGNGTPQQPSACLFEHVLLSIGSTPSAKANHPYNETVAASVLQMQLPNRYFPPETFVYEEDAVVQSQPGGNQWMVIPPPLSLTRVGGNTTVQTSFLQLSGNASVFVGQGSKDIYSRYLYEQPVSSSGRFLSASSTPLPFNFTFTLGTRYLCAWYHFLTNLTAASGLPGGSYSLTGSVALPPSPSVCGNNLGLTYDLTLTVKGVSYATLFFAGTQISFNVGGL